MFITADIVKEGKPFPEGYLLGREQLRVSDPNYQVVVFEDAAVGVRAGKAAGAMVIAVLETHSREALAAAGADYIIENLNAVRVSTTGNGGIVIHLET